MSRNDEERGSFLLPTAAITPLRKALLSAANAEQTNVLTCATAIYDNLQSDTGRMKALKKALKVNSRMSAEDVLFNVANALDPPSSGNMWHYKPEKWSDNVRNKAIDILLKYDVEKKTLKLRRPLKKHAPLLPASTLDFSAGHDGHIRIDLKKRTVSWTVNRNSRAVEDARESRVGGAFFKALNSVNWTRGTGGHITETNEYAEDAARDDGHYDSGRTTTSLGPLGEAHRAEKMGVSVARMRKFMGPRSM